VGNAAAAVERTLGVEQVQVFALQLVQLLRVRVRVLVGFQVLGQLDLLVVL
jgi:hypothetical protein